MHGFGFPILHVCVRSGSDRLPMIAGHGRQVGWEVGGGGVHVSFLGCGFQFGEDSCDVCPDRGR